MESFTLKNGGKMNAYYLKKFRKKAWETIKIQVSICKNNRFNVVGFGYSFEYVNLTLKAAKKVLRKVRNEYILLLCQDKKKKKLNKQLAKL